MNNNYVKPLARILRKAQGRIDAETGKAIHIGDEVQRLRNICDRLRVDSETLKHVSGQPQPVPEGFVLVPVEPTEKWAGRLADGCEISVSHAKDTIETVLAAAPKPGGE